jgi:hypothetical protein
MAIALLPTVRCLLCAGASLLTISCLAACGRVASDGGCVGECNPEPIVEALTTVTINKVDLLFDIDNSTSMADKQDYLEQAVPDLVGRLVQPYCITRTASATPGAPPIITVVGQSVNGACTTGTIEFAPVHDMHIGIISSSLGNRGVTNGGEVCNPTDVVTFADGKTLSNHNDDQGHLLNRTAINPVPAEDEGTSADTNAENFLDWFPAQPAGYDNFVNGVLTSATATNGICPACTSPGPVLLPAATPLMTVGAIGTAGTLEGDFAALLAGVHEYGCGIESQLESWYRFLIQPDPYASIKVIGGLATWWRRYDHHQSAPRLFAPRFARRHHRFDG